MNDPNTPSVFANFNGKNNVAVTSPGTNGTYYFRVAAKGPTLDEIGPRSGAVGLVTKFTAPTVATTLALSANDVEMGKTVT